MLEHKHNERFPPADLPEDDLTASVASVGELCIQSPMSDGTIEEDFEAALAKEASASSSAGARAKAAPVVMTTQARNDSPEVVEDFGEIARHGIVEVVGDDDAGRKVIVVSACRLPSNKGFDHQRFLR